jgi:hypothetical protein
MPNTALTKTGTSTSWSGRAITDADIAVPAYQVPAITCEPGSRVHEWGLENWKPGERWLTSVPI